MALLAKAYEIAEQYQEAALLLEDASKLAERIGERWFASELYRSQGQLMARQGDQDAADGLYRQAFAIARKQDAKLWELRAAVSLAKLGGNQARRAEARERLSSVYAWFNEGFDTEELRNAKSTLDELA
jgi:tetratricopeptide (TPR) repeat protein